MENPVTYLDPDHIPSGAKVLSMKIEIGDGRSDTLAVHENDDPSTLASQFMEKHSLPSFLSSSLISLIQNHKDRVENRSLKQNQTINSSFKSSKSKLTFQKSISVSKTSGVKSSMNRLIRNNIGEQLYTKGLEMLKQKQEASIESSKDFSCSFRPSINEYSRLISPRFFENPEDILMRKSTEFKHKIEAQRETALQEEMKECTFSPNINYTKATMHRNNNRIHQDLFAEAKFLNEKREKIVQDKHAHFQSISKGKNQDAKKTLQEQEEFADNLIKFKDELSKKREEAAQKAILANETPAKKSTRDIHEYLYSKRNDKRNWTEEKQESWQSLMKSVSSPKVGTNSSKIFEELRFKRWKFLFESMDSQETGKINTDNVSIQSLNKDVLACLVPVLKEIEQGKEFDLDEFSSIMENIWGHLNTEERGYLLKKEEIRKDVSEHKSFVSPKSKTLAQKKYARMSGDLYERFQHQDKLREIKMLKAMEISDEAKLKECSFRPKIKKRNK